MTTKISMLAIDLAKGSFQGLVREKPCGKLFDVDLGGLVWALLGDTQINKQIVPGLQSSGPCNPSSSVNRVSD